VLGLSTIPVRFSRRQLLLLHSGIRSVVDQYRRLQLSTRSSLQLARVVGRSRHRGEYDESVMSALMAESECFTRALRGGQRSYRFRRDALDLSFLMFGLRIRRRTSKEDLPGLGRTLERLRKRAQRKAIGELGQGEYQLRARRWKQMLQWLRSTLFPGRAGQRVANPLLRHRLRLVNQLVERANVRLNAESVAVDEALVRQLVRRALRYVRRHRTTFGIPYLLKNPRFADDYLSDFVAKSIRKMKTLAVQGEHNGNSREHR
jgi:hypothetical protein